MLWFGKAIINYKLILLYSVGDASLNLFVEPFYPLYIYALSDFVNVVDHAHKLFVRNYKRALLAVWAYHFGFYLSVANAHDLLANGVIEVAYRLISILVLLLD